MEKTEVKKLLTSFVKDKGQIVSFYPTNVKTYDEMVTAVEKVVGSKFLGLLDNQENYIINYDFNEHHIYVLQRHDDSIKPIASASYSIKSELKKLNQQAYKLEKGFIFPQGE